MILLKYLPFCHSREGGNPEFSSI